MLGKPCQAYVLDAQWDPAKFCCVASQADGALAKRSTRLLRSTRLRAYNRNRRECYLIHDRLADPSFPVNGGK